MCLYPSALASLMATPLCMVPPAPLNVAPAAQLIVASPSSRHPEVHLAEDGLALENRG